MYSPWSDFLCKNFVFPYHCSATKISYSYYHNRYADVTDTTCDRILTVKIKPGNIAIAFRTSCPLSTLQTSIRQTNSHLRELRLAK